MNEIHLSEELKIQKSIEERLSNKGYKYNIITDKEIFQLNKEHNFLLLSPYENVFKGLKEHIYLKNKNLFKEFSDIYSKEEFLEILVNDFVNKWNKAKDNIDYYNLVFNNDFLTISLKDKEGIPCEKSYNVISYNNSADNEYTIIKEKRLKGIKNIEKPDFAMYINGIPLIVFEVKTQTAGIKKAFKEYGTKSTYSKFILCLGTDGKDVFLTGNKSIYFKWQKYGKHITSQQTTGLEDLLSELFDTPKNLLFYFKYGVLISYNKNTQSPECLINHRVQQYYSLKLIDQKLNLINSKNMSERNKDALLNELIKHVQRSGKSITIRSAVNLIADKYKSLFNKIYICVPDLTILKVMKRTFLKNDIKVTEIVSRKDFVNSINTSGATLEVFLHNIQKTSDNIDLEYSDINIKNYDNNVLFIIDEVHFAQSKSQADKRYQTFPNASYLTFTATPKIKEKRKGEEGHKTLVNETAIRYGDNIDGEIVYLDELNAKDAIKMGIILPIFYEKMTFSHFNDQSSARALDEELKIRLAYFLNNSIYKKEMEAEQEEAALKIRKDTANKNLTESEINNLILQSEQFIFLKYLDEVSKDSDKILVEEAFQHIREQKIDFIINDLNKKKKILKNNDDTYSFIPKAFLVVKSKEEARLYLDIIKEKSTSLTNNNVYSGIHFGIDYSEDQISTESNDDLNTLNNIDDSKKIINLFESQKSQIDENGNDIYIDERVDVLIIVDKYLMGYDNPELIAVYCDRTIKEPAKLYQLITRPATTREDKPQGFFVDMILGNSNYLTYLNQCLPYYDNDNGTTIANLTPDEIDIQTQLLNTKITEIRVILGYDPEHIIYDEIEGYNRLISYNENKTPQDIIKRKNQYFECFKDINKILDVLISPKYYIDNIDEIMILLKINSRYLSEDCPKPENNFLFNKDEIKSIINKTLEFFQKDIEDINRFKISNTSTIKDEQILGRIQFNNIISDFKVSLGIFGLEQPKNFAERIKQWAKEISENGFSSDYMTKFKEEFEEPLKKLQEDRKQQIKNIFNNSVTWYMAYNSLKKGLSLIENQLPKTFILEEANVDLLEDFLMKYSKKMEEQLIDIIPDNNIYLAPKSDYLNKIKENIKIELKDFDNKKASSNFYSITKSLREYLMTNDYLSDDALHILSSEKGNSGYLWILFMFDDYYTELYNKSIQ